MSHPVLRAAGLLVVLCAVPAVRLVSCFSIGLAILLSGAVEAVRAWALLPEPPRIPTRDWRWVAPRCEP